MSILRKHFRPCHVGFSDKSDVVYDEAGASVAEIHERMLSGYTPRVRARKYTSELFAGATIKDVMDSIEPRPLDITDVVNSKNREQLHEISIKKQELDEQNLKQNE